jgi:hypothetical protein
MRRGEGCEREMHACRSAFRAGAIAAPFASGSSASTTDGEFSVITTIHMDEIGHIHFIHSPQAIRFSGSMTLK